MQASDSALLGWLLSCIESNSHCFLPGYDGLLSPPSRLRDISPKQLLVGAFCQVAKSYRVHVLFIISLHNAILHTVSKQVSMMRKGHLAE